jgi:hypothetical protein
MASGLGLLLVRVHLFSTKISSFYFNDYSTVLVCVVPHFTQILFFFFFSWFSYIV